MSSEKQITVIDSEGNGVSYLADDADVRADGVLVLYQDSTAVAQYHPQQYRCWHSAAAQTTAPPR